MTNNKKTLLIFLLLPLLDVITSVFTRNMSRAISPGFIGKGLFVCLFVIYILFISKSKYKKKSINLMIISFLYVIAYFAFKPQTLENPFFIIEIKNLFRLLFFPVMFCGLLLFTDENNVGKDIIKKILFYTLVIYFLLLAIPLLTKSAYNTYPIDWKGYVGWFYAGNEIANIMVLLLPFSFYLINKTKYSFLGIYPFFVISMSIGTKVSTFGPLIIAILTALYYMSKN